ncbi:competence protein PilW [Allomeiothermus silvanus DSM 9946]|uniref:Competence protein PilW n=1 Tax=Allomeiothermus silvanus (strain ATCC 700542 / DSM 9946 / NBRC 106475 / NCIMB 13440 / VI-R2) TaxID=526227 RepID=D7BEI3_ALLS1|nr:hypothetical protein [Allomeiothermus silvanus]ADH63226.1 competence protein PilW [Allomeiothermus silvanus DSM 9946]
MNWLRQLPQSTKVLIAVALLALGVTLWYVLFFLPGQNQAASPLPPTSETTSPPRTTPMETSPAPEYRRQPGADGPSLGTAVPARPLEVLPIPFLATQAPAQPETGGQTSTPGPRVPGRVQGQAPPNPFVPLIIETAAPPNQATASLPQPTSIPSTSARVQVRQPSVPLPSTPLPPSNPTPTPLTPRPQVAAPRAAGVPASLSGMATLSGGALPLRLSPLEREVAQPAPRPATPTPQTSTASQPAAPQTPAAPTGLAGFVQEQGIKLAMTTLGPTSVAVFQTKEGYVVVPVGEKIPGTEVLVKTMTANEATLVRGNESLAIKLEGGE